MNYPVFQEGERDAIELTLAEACATLVPHGLDPGAHARMFLRHHRDTVGLLRGTAGRKLKHGEIAELLIEWARAEGDPSLYALRALKVSMTFTNGEKGAERASRIFAPLAHPAIEEDRFVPFAVAVLGGALTPEGTLKTRVADSAVSRNEVLRSRPALHEA